MQKVGTGWIARFMIVILAAMLLEIGCVDARTISVDEYLADLTTPDRPAWLRLVPGQRAYLSPEGGGHETSAYVCATVSDFEKFYVNGPDDNRCSYRRAGQLVSFRALRSVIAPGGNQRFLAEITGLEGGWGGVVGAHNLIPAMPPRVVLRAVQTFFDKPYDEPRLSRSQKTDATLGPSGAIIRSASVQVIKYEPRGPAEYDKNSTTRRVFLKVLDGPSAGRSGWIEPDYLQTRSGYPIKCFCTRE